MHATTPSCSKISPRLFAARSMLVQHRACGSSRRIVAREIKCQQPSPAYSLYRRSACLHFIWQRTDHACCRASACVRSLVAPYACSVPDIARRHTLE
eukprot:669300-Rhodomonas_salina.2